MDQYAQLIQTIALTMGLGWASGINLYAAVLMLGLLGSTGNMELPPGLEVLQNPLVIGAAALMYAAEFLVDKTPGADTAWDGLHTFIRIPAGAMLAASAVGPVDPAVAIAAGLLGGGLAAGSHATKAGTRVLINTSPEPFSNWIASLAEDAAVFGGLWLALQHPLLFLGLLFVFLALVAWFLPKIWRGVRLLGARIARLLGLGRATAGVSIKDPLQEISRLKDLLDRGAISQQEYDSRKQRLLQF